MRKLVAGLFMSLDGVVEMRDPWTVPYFTPDLQEIIQTGMDESDTIVMGRRTYEDYASYWPGIADDEDPFAAYINNTPKLVASSTLKSLDWQNCTLVDRDAVGEIGRLKQRSGRALSVTGSPRLVRSLLAGDLVDELRLLVFPLLLGDGARLFDDWSVRAPMTLLSSRTLDAGVVSMIYAPGPSDTP